MWDTLVWAEATANSGLAGVAAVGPPSHSFTGDVITLRDEPNPYIHRFGGTSDTKPSGCGIVPGEANSGIAWHGPAALHPVPNGILDMIDCPLRPARMDTLTSLLNDTNVNEGAIVWADITYGTRITPWSRSRFWGDGKRTGIFPQDCIVTSAADVTYNSGAVSIHSACVQTRNWYDIDAEYYILGVSGNIGVAAASGILTFTNIGGPQWKGRYPGIPINMLSGVDFGTDQPFTPALIPIGPISGAAMKTAEIGLCSTTAGAMVFTLHIAKTK